MTPKTQKTEQQTPCWYGQKKYHYIIKRGSKIVYRCTSIGDYQDEVVETLIKRFEGENKQVYIFRNGVLLIVLNKPTKASKWL